MLRFLRGIVTRLVVLCRSMRLGTGTMTLVLFMKFFGFLKIMAFT